MDSQKSRPAPAVEPKRQRGRDRVAAIMDAGVSLFMRKGYEAATMTEIAADAGAAIGSLYRFFPTKEALADALIARHGATFLAVFADIEAKAATMTADGLAAALIEAMQSLQPSSAATIALVDARPDAEQVRSSIRAAVRARIAAILAMRARHLSQDEADAAAALLLHVLKAIRHLPRGDAAFEANLARQAQTLVARYLAGFDRRPTGA